MSYLAEALAGHDLWESRLREAAEAHERLTSAMRELYGGQAVERYVRAGGRRIAYVGEYDGGCTGESPRLDALEPTHDVWLPQWPGLHDRLRVYEVGAV